MEPKKECLCGHFKICHNEISLLFHKEIMNPFNCNKGMFQNIMREILVEMCWVLFLVSFFTFSLSPAN